MKRVVIKLGDLVVGFQAVATETVLVNSLVIDSITISPRPIVITPKYPLTVSVEEVEPKAE